MNPPTESDSGSDSSFAVQPAVAPAPAAGEHLNLSDDDAWSNPDGGDDDVNMAGGPEKPDVDQLCPDAAFGGGTVKPRPKGSGFVATGRGGDSSDSSDDGGSDPTPMPAAARAMPGAASKEDSLPAAAGAMAPPPEADDDDTVTESSSGGDVDTLEIEHPPPKPPAAAAAQQPPQSRGPHVDPMSLLAPQAQQRGRLTATPTGPLSNTVVTRMSPNVRDNSPSAPHDGAPAGDGGRDTGSSPPLAGGGVGAANDAGGAPVAHNTGDAIDVDFDDLVVDDLPGGDADDGQNAQDAIDLSGAPVYGSRPDREITQLQRPEPQQSPPRPAAVRTPSGPASPAAHKQQHAHSGSGAFDASIPEVSASSSVSLSAHTSAVDSRRDPPAPAAPAKQQPSKAYLAAKQQTLQQQQQSFAPAGASAPPAQAQPAEIPVAPEAAAGVDDEWDQANDQFVAQQAAAEEEKKKPPLMPIDWDGAVREIRVNQRHTWTKHVTPDLKRVSAKVKTTGFMAACWSCWHNDIVEGSEVYDERDFVLALQKVEFDHSNEIHRRVLITVWRLLTRPKGRDGSDPPTTGPAWEELGFQGSNPATDLRATGLFGLLQMLFLVDYCPRFANALFDLSKSRVYQFPLAIVCFNFTATALNCLLERLLHDQVMARFKDASGDENQARWQREGGTNFVQMVLNELHIGLLHKFYVMWQEEPTRRVMEFDQVRRPVVKYAHERTATALQGYATAKSEFSREKLRDDREKRLKKQLEPVLDKGPSRFTDF